MSQRDGIRDDDYDLLRATGLSRETCWAILSCVRYPAEAPLTELHLENLRFSGVRLPGEATDEPDFLQALEMIRELTEKVTELTAAADAE